MSTPTNTPTTTQVDYIQTASAITHILADRTLRGYLEASGKLTDDQVGALTRRFEDGVSHFKQEVKQHRMPDALEVSRTAIIADYLSHKYTQGIPHIGEDQVKIEIADMREGLRLLTSDMSLVAASRAEWEGMVRATFLTGATTQSRPPAIDQSIQAARSAGMVIARSVGIDSIFGNAFAAGEVPLSPVDPLPTYAEHDPRAQEPGLMAKLQLTLSVTEGILATIAPADPGETHERHIVEWFKDRASKAIDKAKDLVVPAGLSKLSSQLGDKEKILRDSRNLLNTAIYGTEPELATAAADHAVERSLGTILFLSICPNIPFLIPTLELRLAFTRPFFFITRAMHEAMGRIPLVGFLFLLLRGLGQVIDGIPRAQVRFVQHVVTESWLANPQDRAKIIRRYLRYVDRRANQPQIDAIQRVLLSLVQ